MSTDDLSPNDQDQRALEWWTDLQKDRGAAARLRRATLTDAMSLESTLMLFRRLDYSPDQRGRLPRVATLACILAQVREHNPAVRFANAIGRTKLEEVESAALKPLRFQRLVTAMEEEEISRSFRRALAIAGSAVDVADLTRLILSFDTDRTRQRLTFDYFGAGGSAPGEAPSHDQPAV